MTKADERIARLEESIARLEGLGLAGPNPQAVNPDGSPGLVSPGELIESAWGNSVSNTIQTHIAKFANHDVQLDQHYQEIHRREIWAATNDAPAGPFTAAADYPGLTLTVTLDAARMYKATAFIPVVNKTTAGDSAIYIVQGASFIAGVHNFKADAETHSLYAMTVVSGVGGTANIKVQVQSSAGSIAMPGGAGQAAILTVEEFTLT